MTESAFIHPLADLERQRIECLTRGDFDILGRLCHPDLRYTHSTGHTDTYESYLERCRTGFYRYVSLECELQTSVMVGDTVAFTELMRGQVQVDGRPRTLSTHALAVWVKEPESWRFLAYHATGV